MNFRKTIHAILCFLLPGMAAGWLLAASALRYSSDIVLCGVIFSAFACAGAVAGRWLFRHDGSLALGLLLLPGLPLFNFRWLLPGIAFAFAVFAVRPIRPVNRQLFQTGVLVAIAAALAAGGQWLGMIFPIKAALALLLPAAASLLTSGCSCKKGIACMTILAGLSLLLLPWHRPANQPSYLPWGEAASLVESEKNAVLQVGSRIYQLPRDLDRNIPDMLTSALQPLAENMRILVIEEAPSNAVRQFRQFPWVNEVDNILLFSGLPDVMCQPQQQYDLIFIQELSGSMPAARDLFFSRILQTKLAPGGVLAAPAGYTANAAGFHTALLPGSNGRIRLWAEQGTPLAGTFKQLEERLAARQTTTSETSFSGLMQTLYELRPAEPEQEQKPATRLETTLHTLRQYLQKTWLLLPGAVLFLLGICWGSRSPRYGENFAVFVHGTACMLCLVTILQEAGKYQLLLPGTPLAAVFGLLALALPHRSKRAGKWKSAAILCAAAAGIAVSAGIPAILHSASDMPEWSTGAMLLPALFLLAPAIRSGCVHKGGEAARYLHFTGLLAGSLLALASPAWAALLAALLLFAA